MSRVKLAILGAGLMGRKHAETIRASESCALVGVCDVDLGRRPLAGEFDVPFYADAEEDAGSRTAGIAAIIATPNALHGAARKSAPRHGVHVLIEKPIADTLEAAQRIVQTAEARREQRAGRPAPAL